MLVLLTPEELAEGRSDAITLASNIRPLIRASQPVLYHGTRYAGKILNDNELHWPDFGTNAVSFTRSLQIAAHFALLKRRVDAQGAILVLDRDRLAQKFKVECFRDGEWLDRPDYPPMYREAEEIIWGQDIKNLHKYLVDTIWIDESTLTGQSTKQLREAAHLRLPKQRAAMLPPGSVAAPQHEWAEPLAMAA